MEGVPPGVPAHLRNEEDRSHHQETHEQARHDTRNEQIADGRGRDHPVDNKGVARRDQDAEHAAGRADGCGEVLVIPLLLHGGNEQRADRRHSSRTRTGNGREECTGKDGHDGKPARDLAHRRLHHIHKVLRNSAAPHDGPGQHETWNRHQCVLVHPGIQSLCETFQRFAVQDELYQWAYAQRDEDGQTYAETTYDEETKQHMSPQLAEKVWYRR